MTSRPRTAEATIRGFLYQAYVSALAWVQLQEGVSLVFEGIEDLDHYIGDRETPAKAEQIKHLATNVTARSEAGYQTIAEFLCAFSEGLADTFVFTTTAARGQQRTEAHEQQQDEAERLVLDVIETWQSLDPIYPEEVQTLADEVQKLMRRYLRPEDGAGVAKRKFFKRIESAISNLTTNRRWMEFFLAVDWQFNAGGLSDVRSSIRDAIAGAHPLPDLLTDRIVHEVLIVSTRDTFESRRVMRSDLEELFRITNSELAAWHEKQAYSRLANTIEGIDRKIGLVLERTDYLPHILDVSRRQERQLHLLTDERIHLQRTATAWANITGELGDSRLSEAVEKLNRGDWTGAERVLRDLMNMMNVATEVSNPKLDHLMHAARTFRSIALLNLGRPDDALNVFGEIDAHALNTGGSRFAYAQLAVHLGQTDHIAGVRTMLSPTQSDRIRAMVEIKAGRLPNAPPTEHVLALQYAAAMLQVGELGKAITVCISAVRDLDIGEKPVAFFDAVKLVGAAVEHRVVELSSLSEAALPHEIAVAGLKWLRETVPNLCARSDCSADLTELLNQVIVAVHQASLDRIVPNDMFELACAKLDYEPHAVSVHPSWQSALASADENEFGLAVEFLSDSTRRQTATPGCCFYIALAARDAGRKSVAELFARRAAEILPSLTFSALHSEALLALGRPDDALDALDIVGGSKDPRTLAIAAQASSARGRVNEAREFAERWASVDPASPSARLLLAQLQSAAGNTNVAAADAWRVFEDTADLAVPLLGVVADLQRSAELTMERKRSRARALLEELSRRGTSDEAHATRSHVAAALRAYDLLERADFDWMQSQGLLENMSIEDGRSRLEGIANLRNALAAGFGVGEVSLDALAEWGNARVSVIATALTDQALASGVPTVVHYLPPMSFVSDSAPSPADVLLGVFELVVLAGLDLLDSFDTWLGRNKLVLVDDDIARLRSEVRELGAELTVDAVESAQRAALMAQRFMCPEQTRGVRVVVSTDSLGESVTLLDLARHLAEQGALRQSLLRQLESFFDDSTAGCSVEGDTFVLSGSAVAMLTRAGLFETLLESTARLGNLSVYVPVAVVHALVREVKEQETIRRAEKNLRCVLQHIARLEKQLRCRTVPRVYPLDDEMPDDVGSPLFIEMFRETLSWRLTARETQSLLVTADHLRGSLLTSANPRWLSGAFTDRGKLSRIQAKLRAAKSCSLATLVREFGGPPQAELYGLAKVGFTSAITESEVHSLAADGALGAAVLELDGAEFPVRAEGRSQHLTRQWLSRAYASGFWRYATERVDECVRATDDTQRDTVRKVAAALLSRLERIAVDVGTDPLQGRARYHGDLALEEFAMNLVLRTLESPTAGLDVSPNSLLDLEVNTISPAARTWALLREAAGGGDEGQTARRVRCLRRGIRGAFRLLSAKLDDPTTQLIVRLATMGLLGFAEPELRDGNFNTVLLQPEVSLVAMATAGWDKPPLADLCFELVGDAEQRWVSAEDLIQRVAATTTSTPSSVIATQQQVLRVTAAVGDEQFEVLCYPEALLRRLGLDRARDYAGALSSLLGAHDAQVDATLLHLRNKPCAESLTAAHHALVSSVFREIRLEPLVFLRWHNDGDFLGGWPSNLTKLLGLLGESLLEPSQQANIDAFAHVRTALEGPWLETPARRGRVLQVAALPGRLPLLALPFALQAATNPLYSLAGENDGSALSAGELHLAILVDTLRLREHSSANDRNARIERLLKNAMNDANPLSLAAKEATLINHSTQVVRELARREGRSLATKYMYWIAARLYAWLLDQLSSVTNYALVIELLQQCSEFARGEGEPLDVFAVGWFGKDAIDHRLLMAVGALSTGLDLQAEAITIKDEQPDFKHVLSGLVDTTELFRFSEPIIQMLVELASRPINDVERGIRGPRSPGSIFSWDLPTTVPDLALLTLLQHDYKAILELKPEVRVRFWEALAAGELDLRQMSFMAGAAVMVSESLTDAEHVVLDAYAVESLSTETTFTPAISLATELFASGLDKLRESLLNTLIINIKSPIAPILIGRFFLGLARVAETIDDVRNVLDRVVDAAQAAELDVTPFIIGCGHVVMSGPAALREPTFELFETTVEAIGGQESVHVAQVRAWMEDRTR